MERLETLNEYRALSFYDNKIKVTRMEAKFLYLFAKNSHNSVQKPKEHDLFDHLPSFNIYKNFDQLIKTA